MTGTRSSGEAPGATSPQAETELASGSRSGAQTVVSAYRDAGTYRGAAEICGTTHKRVKRIITAHEAGNPPVQREPRPRNYDQLAVLVAERVQATKGRISAKRLLPAARAAGYAGSDRNFRRLVAEAKKAWRGQHPWERRPAVGAPGETLVI